MSDTIVAILDDSGNLMVTGTGVMSEWQKAEDIPWYEERSELITVEIGGCDYRR